jgi:hypothetical protein
MPDRWRDQQNIEHTLGKYIISDKPMSEEQWARERATVIDAPKLSDGYEMNQELSDRRKRDAPRFGDGREETRRR